MARRSRGTVQWPACAQHSARAAGIPYSAMTETSAAPAAAPAAKAAKAKVPRAKPAHPPTSEMVQGAIKGLKERGGSSLIAIKKYIAANYKVDAEKLAPFIKRVLKSGVTSGALVQTKGKGASGSFKLSAATKDKPAKKPAKSPKKKPAGPAKAKKTPKKTTKKPADKKKATKSPAKVKKAKPTKAKKAKSPAKKPKAPKPKKSPAKKAAKKTTAKK
ncbi:histone H1-like [Pollicipes pollicipes]|uniref:histone H1-like n=1 Tax=Pollicipes pollicipes TaxID=41117 RepID=UPI001885386A|nr:histone H1-like [Pollicipes pollicipes]XP_037078917.1 histone H1-like [Pollicipes pollicipes]XP_037078918.1 histone H1-like [Pollicipes pollicipes]